LPVFALLQGQALLLIEPLPDRYGRDGTPRRLPPLDATTANHSLTLSALGSVDSNAGCRVAQMSFVHKKSSLPAAQERRRFQRVKVHLLGRYMLPDRREFPCQIINMSPGGLALLAP